ncbi:hypothetical protein CARUB_v10013863mg [Capsella rubella]|uniref:F-box domain-containing protein n=1 Tax=Capsella rubella TaxID=81985 RepID=R0G5Q1_9BRAS|nr:F-box/kelch-repeat protein At3g18720 [Capsella rubella]EOA30726.1 hypothetical protein CARUB_v10013863mg [Capsella rubella]
MRTRRKIYSAATPPVSESVTARPIVQALPASATRSCYAKSRGGNVGSKKQCIGGLWDVKIPKEMLQEILSRIGLKANIHASLVCKTWLQAAVSIRKLENPPCLLYPHKGSKDGDYLLFDPSRSLTYQLKFPDFKDHIFLCSRDGWLLVKNDGFSDVIFFFNPFTGERIYLPSKQRYFTGYGLTFSAAPTSSSCCVLSFIFQTLDVFFVVETWRPGDSVWTLHHFPNKFYGPGTARCVFSNGKFYCLSTSGYVGVFDPFEVTWNIPKMNPCPIYNRCHFRLVRPVLMTEHDGDVFVMTTRRRNHSKLLVFRLNVERNVWEEMSGLGGLTVFACFAAALTRAGLPAEERNRVYTSHIGDGYGKFGIYYLGCVRCTQPSYTSYMSIRSAWVQPPPHNNFSFRLHP